METRFKNTWYSNLQSVWDAIVPTQQFGHRDFSDLERPQWSIYSFAPYLLTYYLEYQSASITSRVDIAIEAMEFYLFNHIGNPSAGGLTIFTPTASQTPWEHNTFLYQPWLRPELEFSAGNTIVLTGYTATPTPVFGWWTAAEISQAGNSVPNRMYFDPPMILPATMFLTVQTIINPATSGVYLQLLVNWRYREIG